MEGQTPLESYAIQTFLNSPHVFTSYLYNLPITSYHQPYVAHTKRPSKLSAAISIFRFKFKDASENKKGDELKYAKEVCLKVNKSKSSSMFISSSSQPHCDGESTKLLRDVVKPSQIVLRRRLADLRETSNSRSKVSNVKRATRIAYGIVANSVSRSYASDGGKRDDFVDPFSAAEIKALVSLDPSTYTFTTPLHVACYNTSISVVEHMLTSLEVDVYEVDGMGRTAVMRAVEGIGEEGDRRVPRACVLRGAGAAFVLNFVRYRFFNVFAYFS